MKIKQAIVRWVAIILLALFAPIHLYFAIAFFNGHSRALFASNLLAFLTDLMWIFTVFIIGRQVIEARVELETAADFYMECTRIQREMEENRG